jgi:hypothetical protein
MGKVGWPKKSPTCGHSISLFRWPMTANFRLTLVLAATLGGCHYSDVRESDVCVHVDGGYKSAPIDLSNLPLVPAGKEIEKAASMIPRCYSKHQIGPYKNYLMRLGVYVGNGGTYVAYRVAGMTNTVLLFRVNQNGDILDASRTTLPFMTEAGVR